MVDIYLPLLLLKVALIAGLPGGRLSLNGVTGGGMTLIKPRIQAPPPGPGARPSLHTTAKVPLTFWMGAGGETASPDHLRIRPPGP